MFGHHFVISWRVSVGETGSDGKRHRSTNPAAFIRDADSSSLPCVHHPSRRDAGADADIDADVHLGGIHRSN